MSNRFLSISRRVGSVLAKMFANYAGPSLELLQERLVRTDSLEPFYHADVMGDLHPACESRDDFDLEDARGLRFLGADTGLLEVSWTS